MRTTSFLLPNGVTIDNKDGQLCVREVTIRSLQGPEEDLLRDKSEVKAGDLIDRLLRRCITSLGPLESVNEVSSAYGKMLLADMSAALIVLRRHSMGPKYSFSLNCEHCDEIGTYSIDLDTLTTNEQPEEWRGRVGYHAVTATDEATGDDFVFEFRQLYTADQRGLELLKGQFPKERGTRELMLQVRSINGEEVTPKMVKELDWSQRNAIRNAMQATLGGLDTELVMDCKKCERTFRGNMPIDVKSFFYQAGAGSKTASQARPYQLSGHTLSSWLSATAGSPAK